MKSLAPIVLVGAAAAAGWYFFIREPDGRDDQALTRGDPLVGPHYNRVVPVLEDPVYVPTEDPVYIPTEDPVQVPALDFLADIPAVIDDAMHFGRGAVNWLGERWAALTGGGAAAAAAAGTPGAAGAAAAAAGTPGAAAAVAPGAAAISPVHAILGGAVPAVIGLHPEVPRVVGDLGRAIEYRLTGVPQGHRVNGRVVEPVIHVQELTERGEATVRRKIAAINRGSIRLKERALRRARRRGDYERVADIENQLEMLRN